MVDPVDPVGSKNEKLVGEGEGWWKHHFQNDDTSMKLNENTKIYLHSYDTLRKTNIAMEYPHFSRNYIFKGSIFH